MPGTTTARHPAPDVALDAARAGAARSVRRGVPRSAATLAALCACLVVATGCGEYEGDALPGADLDVDAGVDDANPLDPVGPGIDVDPDADGTDLGGVDADGADPLVDADGDPGAESPADDDPVARPFAPVDVPGDVRNVAGLYDASIRRPLGLDVRYVLIDVGGAFVVYDYDQDPYGTGLNCYRVGAPLPLVRDRGDDYLLDGRSVRISRETLGIGFGFTDTLDDDRDGDATEFLYYRYPLLSGLSVLDLNRCR